MKRIFIYHGLTCLLLLSLSACTYHCRCDDKPPEFTQIKTPVSPPTGDQLVSECKHIEESITDSKAYSKKMMHSRFAVYYQAMSRERVSSLQTRAQKIGCE